MASFDPDDIVTTKYTLNNGSKMPAIGLGTYRIRSRDTIMEVVDEALCAGYRLFDTATVYQNEGFLREAFEKYLPKYDLTRDDIFITTKISPADHGGPEGVTNSYKQSVKNLGIEFADLYLIHFPGTEKLANEDKRNMDNRLMIWDSLVELYDNGMVNAIGVSNFTVYHLKQLIKTHHSVIPAVNQVEWHPFYHQYELLEFCKANEIVLQGYSSLGGTSSKNDSLLMHPAVTNIANKLEVTNAQVLLRWALQHDLSLIPKATNPVHIRENISLNFNIPEEDIKIINELGSNNIKYAWDPSNVV